MNADDLVHAMNDDLLDLCGTAAPGRLHVTPNMENVTCPACRDYHSPEVVAARVTRFLDHWGQSQFNGDSIYSTAWMEDTPDGGRATVESAITVSDLRVLIAAVRSDSESGADS
jgi:hypothetical protein